MLRVPGSINSKIRSEVKVLQEWDGYRPDYRLLLGAFHVHLVSKKQRQQEAALKMWSGGRKEEGEDNGNNHTVAWVEQLLRTPIADFRKYVLDLILAPYLIVDRRLDEKTAYKIMVDWLDKCNQVERLTFNPSRRVVEKIRQAQRSQIRHMRCTTLQERNPRLYAELLNKK
jgi:hypothetical protein